MRAAIRQVNRVLLAALLWPRLRPTTETPAFKNFCGRFGFGVLKCFPLMKSADYQDLWALCESDFKRDGFFVEIGAANGFGGSTTYLLEKHFGWQGILAEANPVHFERLAELRSSSICRKAVHKRSGETLEFWHVPDHPGLASLAEYALNDMHAATRQRAHVPIMVETISLNDLLSSFGAPRVIDYINIDTEGSEYDILCAFDFDYYDVHLFSVEHNYSASEQRVTNLLSERGYRRVFPKLSRIDGWFVRTRQGSGVASTKSAATHGTAVS
jgi:FkbM family methyltransferase